MKIPQYLSRLSDDFVSGNALTAKLDPKILAQQEATPFTYWLLAGNSEQLQPLPLARSAKLLFLNH